jgi:hypothetical protein
MSVQHWQELAETVLATLLCEEPLTGKQAHYWDAVRMNQRADDYPIGKWRDLSLWIVEQRVMKKAVVLATIPRSFDVAWIDSLRGRWGINGTIQRGFSDTYELMRQEAQRASVSQALQYGLSIVDDKNPLATADEVMHQLSASAADSMIDMDASAFADAQRARIAAPPPPTANTGLEIIDRQRGLLRGNDHVGIVGASGSRKTTLMLNMTLKMLSQGYPCALLMLESGRDAAYAQLTSMLSGAYLQQYGAGQRAITTRELLIMGNRFANAPEVQHRALEYALDMLSTWGKRLVVFDKTSKGGNLSDIASVLRIITYAKARYAVEFVGVDHLQRIGTGTDYEKVQLCAPALETITRSQQLMTVTLSQATTSANRSNVVVEESRAVGGQGLDNSCDWVVQVYYRAKLDESSEPMGDNEIHLKLTKARYGSLASEKCIIDPLTGLILPSV